MNSLAITIFIVLIILKLTGTIDWSWWWITAPIWFTILFYLIFLINCAIFGIGILLLGAL